MFTVECPFGNDPPVRLFDVRAGDAYGLNDKLAHAVETLAVPSSLSARGCFVALDVATHAVSVWRGRGATAALRTTAAQLARRLHATSAAAPTKADGILLLLVVIVIFVFRSLMFFCFCCFVCR